MSPQSRDEDTSQPMNRFFLSLGIILFGIGIGVTVFNNILSAPSSSSSGNILSTTAYPGSRVTTTEIQATRSTQTTQTVPMATSTQLTPTTSPTKVEPTIMAPTRSPTARLTTHASSSLSTIEPENQTEENQSHKRYYKFRVKRQLFNRKAVL